ncbi:MAG: 23S rRNA (adenine(2503)-C(2))-methyltransferase RlmN [Nitrospirae bacterium]|nr:23S rRNA (adenine(2503)-C(2))-methyltransferase RlmN [Nitrospirota bacterium]MCL5422868.1 23S rRNA (adenine(2503)-C(2))-methyltransferase RlmN [Nitrospirota bacterium]
MNLKTDLKALSKKELESFIKEQGLPAFRARQLRHWIYERRAESIDEITEFSKDLREGLSKKAYISTLKLLSRQISADGTEKFLFGLEDGESIESVLIPDKDRLTLCISSQVGCAMKCRFCLTAQLRLRRNLRAHEIVDQVICGGRLIHPRSITNIVFMGMGEPLANFYEAVEALWRMTELMKISKRRITLSTAGIAPKILELAEKAPRVNLAISLNATTDEVRSRLMPINKKYPLRSLLDACRRFPLEPRRRITFEYVMLQGLNDTQDDARRLIRILKGIPSKVNLIPFNPYPGSEYRRPSDEEIERFQKIVLGGNVTALIRKSKGQDILAACGQLKAGYG